MTEQRVPLKIAQIADKFAEWEAEGRPETGRGGWRASLRSADRKYYETALEHYRATQEQPDEEEESTEMPMIDIEAMSADEIVRLVIAPIREKYNWDSFPACHAAIEYSALPETTPRDFDTIELLGSAVRELLQKPKPWTITPTELLDDIDTLDDATAEVLRRTNN